MLNKFFRSFIVIATFTACTEFGLHVKGRKPINISEALIPAAGHVSQDVEIVLRAEAPSGCWSDLKVSVHKMDEFHFLFKADGFFESRGLCPDIIVSKDTLITFKTGQPGKYFFQTNESPLPVMLDSLEIK